MTKISAHSGFDNTKANSLESITTAVTLGVDILEIDIMLHEGVPVLSHDKPMSGEKTTPLWQVLELLKQTDITINCDAKEEDVIPHAIKLLNEYGCASKYFFTGYCPANSINSSDYKFFINSENSAVLNGFKMIEEKEAALMVELFKNANNINFLGYNINYKFISDEAIKIFGNANIPVICWTVDDRESLDRFLRSGIYAVTTNNVRYAREEQKKLSL